MAGWPAAATPHDLLREGATPPTWRESDTGYRLRKAIKEGLHPHPKTQTNEFFHYHFVA